MLDEKFLKEIQTLRDELHKEYITLDWDKRHTKTKEISSKIVKEILPLILSTNDSLEESEIRKQIIGDLGDHFCLHCGEKGFGYGCCCQNDE